MTTPVHAHPSDGSFYPGCARCRIERAAPGMLQTLYRVRNFLACSGKALANSNCARIVKDQISKATTGN